MVERIKNKKGFTIIEIMVVIALIGILAAVLVPNFAGVKDTARNAGVLANAKTVEAYVASTIDSRAVGAHAAYDTAITAQFDGTDALTNPITGVQEDASIDVTTEDPATLPITGTPGVIYVVIDEDTLNVHIVGMDANGDPMPSTERIIER